MTLEEALVSVWRQVLLENSNLVEIDGRRFPVRRTSRLRLRQVDFELGGDSLRGIEQNAGTRTRWARLAGQGAKIMQFTRQGRFIGNVADEVVTMFDPPAGPPQDVGQESS
jgi:hypothetical protein